MAGRRPSIGLSPLGYMGVKPITPPELIIESRAPTANDVIGYAIGTQWLWKNTADSEESLQYVLVSVAQNQAVWLPLNLADNIELPDHSVALGTGVAGLSSVGPGAVGEILLGQGNADPVFGLTPTATVGQPIVSVGAGVIPEYGTASVSGGGTGLNVIPQYAVVCGGITGEGPLQTVAGLGTATQVLTSNGLGNLPTWENPTGGAGGNGGPIAVQVFDTAGAHVYAPTATAASCFVEIIGGGGGGGGVGVATGHAGGGGAGSYVRKFFLISALGATENLVVGAGGAGGAAGANPGADAGLTSFGTAILISAGGGLGAPAGAAAAVTEGAVGGTVITGGDVNVFGGNGGQGLASADSLVSGCGGDNLYGSGGLSVGVLNAGAHVDGQDGASYGGGGGGGVTGGDATAAGGDGSDGVVIITEYGPYAPTPPADPIQINIIKFDTPGADTYVPTVGMFQCKVECIGGGGASSASSTSSTTFNGAGAGSGGYTMDLYDEVTIGVSQDLFVGAGGSGTTRPGGNGQNTTFGTVVLMTAGGGTGANGGPAANGAAVGTNGGTATGGILNVPGQAGTNMFGLSGLGSVGGAGGSTIYGHGGKGVITNLPPITNGAAGTGYGSAGGGALTNDTTGSPVLGGNGASGVVIITEYIAI